MDWPYDGQYWGNIPDSCPFTIEEYHIKDGLPNSKHRTFLIREHDKYGEYPHIYAKICQSAGVQRDCSNIHDTQQAEIPQGRQNSSQKVIVLSDTGCGTEVRLDDALIKTSSAGHTVRPHVQQPQNTRVPYPKVWNIGTFLEYTINPGSQIPYLIMTTHCHYDHIMGISKFPPTANTDPATTTPRSVPPTTVLTSSHSKAFVTPYANLQKHSLADTLGLSAPKYDVGIWAEDFSQVVYHPQSNTPTTPIATPYTILHTPGHTPDSLSWYDAEHHVLCVGDSFYLKRAVHHAPWGDEPPMPTMFNLESNLADWWRSLHKVLDFVVRKNRELEGEAAPSQRRTSSGAGARDAGRNELSSPRRPASFNTWSFPFPARSNTSRQTGFGCEPRRESELSFRSLASPRATDDAWVLVDFASGHGGTAQPRVQLAAAHTTSATDAHSAILEIRAFVAAILRDDGSIPKRRVADGTRGEEMWLWDHALADEATPDTALMNGRRFSVLAPLVVIQEGRREISSSEWWDV